MGDIGKDNGDATWGWMLGFLIFVGSLVISFLVPPIAPVLGVALIVGGAVAYRQTIAIAPRIASVAALVAGVAIVLTLVLVGSLLSVRGGAQIIEGTLPTPK